MDLTPESLYVGVYVSLPLSVRHVYCFAKTYGDKCGRERERERERESLNLSLKQVYCFSTRTVTSRQSQIEV